MGILARLFGRWIEREQGVMADRERQDDGETPHVPKPPPTPTTRPLERPAPTPSTQQLAAPGATAGTRRHSAPGGTPSTQRIHNPPRSGH
jgi:hypothetical protein